MARFAAIAMTAGVCTYIVALDVLLVATGVVDPQRLFLNVPCFAVEVLTVLVR